MSSPSMVHRSGDTLVVRSVVSGDALYQDEGVGANADQRDGFNASSLLMDVDADLRMDGNDDDDDLDLPQCKIKRNYACTHCEFFSQNPRNYLYHLKGVHKQKIKVYECPSCLYASKHSQKLQRHVHMVHVMNKRGNNKKMAASRKKPARRAPPPLQAAAIATVPAASRRDSSGKDVVKSVVIESPAVPAPNPGELLTCSICGFATRNSNAMARHEKLVHLKKRFFRCSKCNYVTHMRARYTKHVKYHSMPMIKCDLCDFRTPYKWNLDRHYKNHQGDGAYKCSLCNFTADIKQSLTVHEMNHHVPPVGQVTGASVGRRRNKVGASDSMQTAEVEIDQEEMELLRMERENDEDADNNGVAAATTTPTSATTTTESKGGVAFYQQATQAQSGSKPAPARVRAARTPRHRANLKKLQTLTAQRVLDDDFVHPADGNVYLKALRLRCSRCPFTASWPAVMQQHELTAHARPSGGAAKKPARPIPNLIPIAGGGAKSPPLGLPILRIPSVARRAAERPMSAQDLDDICAQGCANSSLRDFASLMAGDAFDAAPPSAAMPPAVVIKTEPRSDDEDAVSEPTLAVAAETALPPTTVSFKKKNASFFDKLKEKLLVGGGAADLTCWCGHESKCLSEQMRHRKLHAAAAASARDTANGKPAGVGTILTAGAELSSTRCQHCRQRCKTSADLVNHLQSCADANRALNATPPSGATPSSSATPISSATPSSSATPTSEATPPGDAASVTPVSESVKSEEDEVDEEDDEDEDKKDGDEPEEEAVTMDTTSGPHPMENKVFVWTSLPAAMQEADCEEECLAAGGPGGGGSPAASEGSLVGVETAPGYGAVTGSTAGDAAIAADGKPVKKVFKCPHCTFWASTASRFHVHIVGHLNKKPFECSLCAYRSNWRWDITKHIRLKSARDVNHETAGVLMTDETGRRNYSKYNKYLTLMRVHEPSAESSGSGRRSKPGSETSSPTKLPPPPHLTRAPSPGAPRAPVASGPLRPPPALRPAAPRLRPAAPRRASATDGRKTLWKCKKCNFRDARRELVLAHVKEHYQQREAASQATPPSAASTNGIASERHCRLKHSGDVKVVRGPGAVDDTAVEETSQPGLTDAGGLRQCEICPFACLSAGEMSRHNEHHSSWPGASYRCSFCLYFVSHKRDLVSHLRLHGVADPEEHLARQRQARGGSPRGRDSAPSAAAGTADELSAGAGSPRGVSSPEGVADGGGGKRYRCVGCPYVSNSKSQFLYHKQFHRPRGAPFKCTRCTYNVSRRHLLHQHMRVHGVLASATAKVVPVTKPIVPGDHEDQIEEVSAALSPCAPSLGVASPDVLDTRTLPDVPLVWVSRAAKFFKMYKCRFCPHVNVRKANITEHEKMHAARQAKPVWSPRNDGPGVDVKQEPGLAATPTQHRCPDCNYVCNNAGVLSSHAKVHQGLYGEVRCLVDATRTDESQLQELAEAEPEATPPNAPPPSLAPPPFQAPPPASVPVSTTPPGGEAAGSKRLVFCAQCPARFLFPRELAIHVRFHDAAHVHRCQSCSYAARQRPHLLAHLKVHSEEYQRRSDEISALYATSPLHPRPRAVLVDRSGGGGATWVVIGGTPALPPPPVSAPHRADKHHACQLCPASFFKSVALAYHVTLHGGAGPHRCRHCDYAVKTYGNLVKHEMIHGNGNRGSGGGSSATGRKRSRHGNSAPLPISGTELFRHRTEMQLQSVSGGMAMVSLPRAADPVFGTQMLGNPEYTYPTYFKNGRLKEKRYKCHKCPSAFEKREQYKVHLSLHGSKQRYRCERCDYSVKYYANYIQHTRKHADHPDNPARRPSDESLPPGSRPETPHDAQTQQRSAKSIGVARSNGPIQLSVADRQSLLLQQLKRASSGGALPSTTAAEERSFGCPHCPYSSARRDGVESHVRRHAAVSGVRGAFVCQHCDYSVPQQHFLREHNKVHFGAGKRSPPEAFMRCSRMELFLAPDKENVVAGDDDDAATPTPAPRTVVFADAGVAATARFLPALATPLLVTPSSLATPPKVFVNEMTGEPLDAPPPSNDLVADGDNEDCKVKVEAASEAEAESEEGSPDE